MDRTNHHRHALHLAVIKQQPESLATLLALGADVEVLDAAGLTALDQAALSGERDMAQRLIDHGARIRLPAAVALALGEATYFPRGATDGLRLSGTRHIPPEGPVLILPNLGYNEWGHAYWLTEEIFSHPLHWGFVVLGWNALALPGVALAPAEAGPGKPWKGEPSSIGGTARYDRGEWIYTDFVYDDYGADTGTWGQPNVVGLAPTSGDARYPRGDEYADNAADIVEVRARARRDDLEIRVLLQTVVDESVVALWVKVGDDEPRVVHAGNAEVDAAEGAHALLSPLRDLFAAIFFAFVGLSVDPSHIPPVLVPAILLASIGVASKFATGWLGAGRLGVGTRGRIRAGTTLIARGEFSIAIAGLATAAGIEARVRILEDIRDMPSLIAACAVTVLVPATLGGAFGGGGQSVGRGRRSTSPSAAGATRLGIHAAGGAAAGVASMIDHTLLKPDASRAEIEKLCREAAEFKFATVCVNPVWVAEAARLLRIDRTTGALDDHGVGPDLRCQTPRPLLLRRHALVPERPQRGTGFGGEPKGRS